MESQIVLLFFVLVLSIFLGVELISKVPSTLHTPLMSGANAISGITLVGAILASGSSGEWSVILGTAAVIFASINVVGGYYFMPRKPKYEKPETKTGSDIEEAEVGDFCYFLNYSNKPEFAEIKKVFEENGIHALQVLSQTDFKFLSVPSKICSFDEKALKGKKRHELCPEVYGAK